MRIKVILLMLHFEFQRVQGNGFSKWGVGKTRRTSTVQSCEDSWGLRVRVMIRKSKIVATKIAGVWTGMSLLFTHIQILMDSLQ